MESLMECMIKAGGDKWERVKEEGGGQTEGGAGEECSLVKKEEPEWTQDRDLSEACPRAEEGDGECGVSVQCARVKEEPGLELEHDSSSACARAAEEAGGQTEGGASEECARAKEEPEWTQDRDLSEACPRAVEGDGECGVSVQCARVKEEPGLEREHDSSSACARAGEEAGGQTEGGASEECSLVKKEEPEWTQDRDSSEACPRAEEGDGECGVSKTAARAALFSCNEVKGKLVMSPDQCQPSNSAFTPTITPKKAGHIDKQTSMMMACIRNPESGPRTTESWWDQFELRSCSVNSITQDDNGTRGQKSGDSIGKEPKPYESEIYFKQFSKKFVLVKPELIHTREKPFKCDICMKRFCKRTALVRHKRIHTGLKPFTCDICLKEFTRQTGLVLHYRIHSGEKPFQCEICMKRFTQKTHLRVHGQTHRR